MIYYKQVLMNNYINGMLHYQVAWIPEYFAVENKKISLEDGKHWRYGWVIVKVYEGRKSEQDILNMESNYNYIKKVLQE